MRGLISYTDLPYNMADLQSPEKLCLVNRKCAGPTLHVLIPLPGLEGKGLRPLPVLTIAIAYRPQSKLPAEVLLSTLEVL